MLRQRRWLASCPQQVWPVLCDARLARAHVGSAFHATIRMQQVVTQAARERNCRHRRGGQVHGAVRAWRITGEQLMEGPRPRITLGQESRLWPQRPWPGTAEVEEVRDGGGEARMLELGGVGWSLWLLEHRTFLNPGSHTQPQDKNKTDQFSATRLRRARWIPTATAFRVFGSSAHHGEMSSAAPRGPSLLKSKCDSHLLPGTWQIESSAGTFSKGEITWS